MFDSNYILLVICFYFRKYGISMSAFGEYIFWSTIGLLREKESSIPRQHTAFICMVDDVFRVGRP